MFFLQTWNFALITSNTPDGILATEKKFEFFIYLATIQITDNFK